MANDAFKRYVTTLPKVLNPEFNEVIKALFLSIAESDNTIATQIQNGKDQLFVRTATGKSLDKLANSLGVSRPKDIGLNDTDFQELIPNLSLKPRQIKKSFYDTADVFWGLSFSRTNITSTNAATYNISVGDEFKIKVDGGSTQTKKVLTGDVAVGGAATALEIQTVLSRFTGLTVSIINDTVTGNDFINLRTNTPGSVGTLEIVTASGWGTTKVDFTVGEYDINTLDQRFVVYNVNPNELIIEIPAIVPSLRRTLKGSHHFHANATLESPVAPNNGIWVGSFFFNPSGSESDFTITSQRTTTTQTINKGDILTTITMADLSSFEQNSGQIMIDFGLSTQEGPINYRGIPNTNTLLIDPSYKFQQDHASGANVNVLSSTDPLIPRRNGNDYAIYLTSPSQVRSSIQDILETLKAAGIVITFVVLAPTYKYIIDNPYLDTDDAPSI